MKEGGVRWWMWLNNRKAIYPRINMIHKRNWDLQALKSEWRYWASNKNIEILCLKVLRTW